MNLASPLQLDDEVEIIEDGHRFKISQIMKTPDGTLVYSAPKEIYYPASSLRKVDELQIGDKVEVIGPTYLGYEGMKGLKSHIWRKTDTGNFEIFGSGFFPASSLRKLAPDEIPHGQTIGEAMQEFSGEVEKAKDAIRDILAPLVDARLSATEERLGNIDRILGDRWELHTQWRDRLSAIEKRLAFVEAFQKEQIENALDPKTLPRTDLTLDAMIADGTLEVADFRKKDIKTQRKIIKQMEDDLACNGMTCAECMDEVEDIRIAALDYAIRSLRMPDMDNDPEFAHGAADVLEEMMEEMKK